ncbi:MAG: ribosome-binding factor A [Pseudomonadota bacterium]
MTTDGRRGKRVAELMRAYLAELMRREVDDPRLAAVVITTVEVTDDLMSARIGVRLLVGDEDPKTRAVVMKSLAKGAGRLRRLIRTATRIASLAGTALSL